MNLLGILTGWTGGQRFGISEQFARAGIELSGISGWFALAPAAQILPRGDRPRCGGAARRDATGQLSHATDDLSRPPGQLENAPGGLETSPGGLEHAPSHLSRCPGHPSRSPGEPENAPTRTERLPSEPEGSGAARRPPAAARREGLEAPRRGMAARRRPGAAPRSPAVARREGVAGARTGLDGPRRPGAARRGGGVVALARAVFVPEGRRGAPPRHGWSIARAVFVPEGRRDVATGGAQGRRPERNPWTGAGNALSAPAGRRSFAGCASAPVDAPFLCPSGAEENMNDAFHGLRSLEDSLTPPVATALDPSGVEDDGAARAIGARARAGGRLFSAGEVPEGRHAPLASADLHAGGSGVRRGF